MTDDDATPSDADRPAPSRAGRYFLAAAILAWGAVAFDILNDAYLRAGRAYAMGRVECALVLGLILFLVLAVYARRAAEKLSVSLVMLLVCLGLFEAAAWGLENRRLFVWPPYTERKHDLRGAMEQVKDGVFSTNSRGIRGPEFSPGDRYRILAIGGSTTECLYLDDAREWPRLLDHRLDRRWDAEVWVGNVGRAGLATVDHVTLARHLPEAEAVDCWLVLCGYNDLIWMAAGNYDTLKAKTFERTFPGRSGKLRRPYHRNLFLYRFLRARFPKFSERAVLQDLNARWLWQLRNRRAVARKTDALPDLAPFLAEYERQLSALIDLARRKKKRLVFLTQPVLWRADWSEADETRILAGWLPDGRYLAAPALAEGMRRFNDRLRAVCAATGTEVIDLARALPPEARFFYDDCHYNDPGAAEVARIVAEGFAARHPDAPPPQRR